MLAASCFSSLCLSCLSLHVSHHPDGGERKGEDETKKTRKSQSDRCFLSLPSSSISILLHPAVVHAHHHFRQRKDGAEEEVVEEGWSRFSFFSYLIRLSIVS